MAQMAFYKGKGRFFDKVVRWWTGGKYSHCELVFSNDTYFSADAWENEVRFKRMFPNPENWDFVALNLTQKEELVVRAWCDSQEGKRYDYTGILLSQVMPLHIEDPNRWFCSELCVAALQRVGRLPGLLAQDIDPSELAVLLGLE